MQGASGVLTPAEGRGLVSTVGPIGLFYANAVGASRVVSAGQNCDRLASAAHRWGLALVKDKEFPFSYFLRYHGTSGVWDIRKTLLLVAYPNDIRLSL